MTGKTAVVAGNICLDVIPELPVGAAARLSPGALVECGRVQLASGGAVSNVGLALKRLGVPVRLAGRVGDDLFGRGLLELVRAGAGGRESVAGMNPVPGTVTSYSVVLSPPDADRSFLHCPGANDEFGSADVSDALLEECDLLHFGYPPIMRRMYTGGGAECAKLLDRARDAGLTVSLDMARPDPASPAGRVDWTAWLERVLPAVDVFLPSVEEILFMLDRPGHDEFEARPGGVAGALDGELLAGLATRLVAMGTAVAVIKLGESGLYLRTTPDAGRLTASGSCAPEAGNWAGRELYAPCFDVEVAGTTGSGDCTIAGFLAALVRGLSPEEALEFAVAVGACSVEAADATGGVRDWDATRARVAGGWPRRAPAPGLAGWRRCGGVLAGPDDGGGR